MSWRRLEDVLKTSWRRIENVLKTFWQDVFKTSWRCFEDVLTRRPEDVLKKPWNCLEDVWPGRINWSWSWHLEDVFWRRISKWNILVLIKTFWRRLHQDECLLGYYGNVFCHFCTRASERMGISNLTGKRLKNVKHSAIDFSILATDTNKFILIKCNKSTLNKTIKSFPLELFDSDDSFFQYHMIGRFIFNMW